MRKPIVCLILAVATLTACALSPEPTGSAPQGDGSGGTLNRCDTYGPSCPAKSFSDCGNVAGAELVDCCATNKQGDSATLAQCAVIVGGVPYWLTNTCPPSCAGAPTPCAIDAAGGAVCGPL